MSVAGGPVGRPGVVEQTRTASAPPERQSDERGRLV
jgi:hypothetical protein